MDVAAIILYNNKKVLLQLRTKDAPYLPDYWAFFGGGIEKGETPLQAVIRETKEELEYDIKNPVLVDISERPVKGKCYTFVEKYDEKQELILNEGADMNWFSEEEIQTLKTPQHNKEVLSRVFKKIKTFINKPANQGYSKNLRGMVFIADQEKNACTNPTGNNNS